MIAIIFVEDIKKIKYLKSIERLYKKGIFLAYENYYLNKKTY